MGACFVRPCIRCYDRSQLNGCTNENCVKYIPPVRIAKVVSVYDGDTITVAAKVATCGKPMLFKVRLAGIDTPELRTKNKKEKELGLKARDALRERIDGKIVSLENVALEKYGRVLCDVVYKGVNLNQWLIDEGHAKPYDGGTKDTNWESAGDQRV